MNIRNEWNALGKLVGLALQIATGYGLLLAVIALLEMAGL